MCYDVPHEIGSLHWRHCRSLLSLFPPGVVLLYLPPHLFTHHFRCSQISVSHAMSRSAKHPTQYSIMRTLPSNPSTCSFSGLVMPPVFCSDEHTALMKT